jgi:hypothetical protein
MLSAFGPTPNEWAICGNAVAMTVVSRYSMKNVPATMYGSQRAAEGVGNELLLIENSRLSGEVTLSDAR